MGKKDDLMSCFKSVEKKSKEVVPGDGIKVGRYTCNAEGKYS